MPVADARRYPYTCTRVWIRRTCISSMTAGSFPAGAVSVHRSGIHRFGIRYHRLGIHHLDRDDDAHDHDRDRDRVRDRDQNVLDHADDTHLARSVAQAVVYRRLVPIACIGE